MAVITILSDSVFLPTGYSNQSKLLAKYLRSKGHEIHYLANGYNGATIDHAKLEDGTIFDYKIYGQKNQQYFADLISPHLKQTKSDIFLVLLDTFMLHGGNGWFLGTDTAPAQTFFWFPSDGGGGLPVGCDAILRKIDFPVAMAKYGQKQCKDYYDLKTNVIPHGTEPNRFYKLPDEQRAEAKKKWGLTGKFVVGVVARNQPRKNLDRTLKSFYFLKNKVPNAVLFLHLDPDDPAQAFNMKRLISKYNLENRVVFSGLNAQKGFGWDELNEVYNAMDMFFLSTSGEGFGIPIIEAMSCEIPVLATDYTTTQELVLDNNAGLGIDLASVDKRNFFEEDAKEYDKEVSSGTVTGGWEVERGYCDCQDAAKKIEFLYKNPQMCKEMGLNGRKAVLEKYDFNNIIGPSWEKLMLKSIDGT